MWGFLLGGALSLIGSFFSKPDPQPEPPPPPPPPPPAPAPQVVVVEKQTNEVDMKKLVKDSEEAGFNPLTVVRNGGLAGYQVTNVPFLTTNPAFVDWEAKNKADTDHYNWEVNKREIAWRNSNAEKQWMGSLISGVGGMAMNFAEKYNPLTMARAEERRVLENDLMRSEIMRNNSSVSRMFQPNVATVSGNVQKARAPVDIFGASGLTGDPQKWGYKVNEPQITNPAPAWWRRTNLFGDMQNWEDAYAEIVSNTVGLASVAVDGAYTGYFWADRGLRRAGQWLVDTGTVKVKPAPKGASNSFTIDGVRYYDAGSQ